MSEMGFEIGSHGVTHTLLSRLDKNCQRKELYNSKKLLEELLSKILIHFAISMAAKKVITNIP